jgi:hypothetical protein
MHPVSVGAHARPDHKRVGDIGRRDELAACTGGAVIEIDKAVVHMCATGRNPASYCSVVSRGCGTVELKQAHACRGLSDLRQSEILPETAAKNR